MIVSILVNCHLVVDKKNVEQLARLSYKVIVEKKLDSLAKFS
ncbi:hypothetical protein [Wolbachia endosymbiont of Trichogramma pretiosum]|nr:hypothetical protein [Wolbachia endosymbiont of Trichogramma pretiosum]OCA06458.1 hypothetical protein wTpre_792 [Wolbachia endosymbiont of Trichogramma pretiosum]